MPGEAPDPVRKDRSRARYEALRPCTEMRVDVGRALRHWRRQLPRTQGPRRIAALLAAAALLSIALVALPRQYTGLIRKLWTPPPPRKLVATYDASRVTDVLTSEYLALLDLQLGELASGTPPPKEGLRTAARRITQMSRALAPDQAADDSWPQLNGDWQYGVRRFCSSEPGISMTLPSSCSTMMSSTCFRPLSLTALLSLRFSIICRARSISSTSLVCSSYGSEAVRTLFACWFLLNQ